MADILADTTGDDEVTIKMPRQAFEGLRMAVKGLGELLDQSAGEPAIPEELPPDQAVDDGPLAGFAGELDAASPR